MRAFERAKWIWTGKTSTENEYGEFFCMLYLTRREKTVCRISCDGDYVLFINGKYVASNQYGDFEYYKIYDEVDITESLRDGDNAVRIICWHFGTDTQRYKKACAGVIFEVTQGKSILLGSDESVLCQKSKTYKSGRGKTISPQLGYSFFYDATRERERELVPATLVEKNCTFFPRPVDKLKVLPKAKTEILKSEGNYYLIDLGKETVGLPVLEFYSETEQNVLVAWGEDLQEGHVRRIIGNRDFSFEYRTKKGENSYVNYMLRLGCRYLEVYSEKPIVLKYVGVLPQVFPVKAKKKMLKDPQDQKIFDVCVETLKLCMMEHYVDTPWREQCLYAFDSRNQILCGYYAFESGNKEYARANLKLMSEDRREDGLLSITYPCGADLTIPSFSLYYFLALKEYVGHTGDRSLVEETYPKLCSIVETFLRNRKNGLICKFEGKNRWNFYDWSEYSEGVLFGEEEPMPDLIINCLFLIALECFLSFGAEDSYREFSEEIKTKLRLSFYDKEAGVYAMTEGGKEFAVLGNALAILADVATEEERKAIAEKIVRGKLFDCSLSMRTFKYDALLKTDREKYKAYIIEEIRRDYGKMLETGATSVWETIDGAAAFGNAGSLCHGWSSIPVYYLSIL